MITRTKRMAMTALLVTGFLLTPITVRAQEEFTRLDNVKVPMSDGTNLAVDVYLPSSGEKFPAVLVRTPYSRKQLGSHIAVPLAKSGYVVVMQDVRGMGDSEGLFIPFIQEKQDGLDTLDWMVKQAWCDGKIGMWGSSYPAFCALIVAPEQHPSLKAIFDISGWGNTVDMTSPGGAMHLMVAAPWTLSRQIRGKGSISRIDWPTAFRHVPVVDIPTALGIESPQWKAATEMYTGDFLTETAGVAGRYDRVETPIFHLTGWYDFVSPQTLDMFEGVDQATHGKNQAPFQKLLVGPWRHDQQWGDETLVGDEDFGAVSIMGMEKIVKLTTRWFDHWLKGIDNGITKDKPVELFVMGANAWRTFDRWPPQRVAFQKWHVGSKEGANGLAGDGGLVAAEPTSTGHDSFTFDPMDPVPTDGGANCHFFLKTLGVRDQRSMEERRDVLVYTSPPLEEDLTIIGPLTAVIYASTEGRHTDFTAKLVEVRSDGYARIIRDGIRRGPDSSPLRKIEPMEPGKVYRFTIDLGETAIAIAKGHRLRLDVSSSNFPKFTRNPNTGESPERATEFRKVVQRVYFSEQYPSHVLLPVLK